jgi:hypothetical protein
MARKFTAETQRPQRVYPFVRSGDTDRTKTSALRATYVYPRAISITIHGLNSISPKAMAIFPGRHLPGREMADSSASVVSKNISVSLLASHWDFSELIE